MSSPTVFDDLDPRTPVVAGVGVASQRVDEPGGGDDAATLMTTAALRAGADSGASGILAAVQQVAVPAGTWAYPDPGRIVAERIDAVRARTVLVQVGIPQQTLFDDAYHAIRAGTIDVALVVGGEAARRAAVARRAGIEPPDFEQGDIAPDELQLPKTEIITRLEIEGGIASAMAPFALIDSALRFAEGRTIDEQRDEIAWLYAGFSAVAATFPDAAFPESRSEEFLREPSEANRPFAFPYNKWHCAQMNVDQAAAILICSADAARRLGVDPTPRRLSGGRTRIESLRAGEPSAGAAPLARDGSARRGRRGAPRSPPVADRVGRDLQLLSRRGARAAARASGSPSTASPRSRAGRRSPADPGTTSCSRPPRRWSTGSAARGAVRTRHRAERAHEQAWALGVRDRAARATRTCRRPDRRCHAAPPRPSRSSPATRDPR